MSPYRIKGLNNQACVPKMTICWLYTLFLLNQVESEAQKWKRKKVYGSWKTCKVVEFHHIILQACKFMEFASGSYRDMGNFLKFNFGEQLIKGLHDLIVFILFGATLSFACENFKCSLEGHWKSWNFMIFERI